MLCGQTASAKLMEYIHYREQGGDMVVLLLGLYLVQSCNYLLSINVVRDIINGSAPISRNNMIR